MKSKTTTRKLKRQRLLPASACSAAGWEWFGHAAHFICGRWCRFHMATKVGKYLVSTVGEYVHPRHSNGSEMQEAGWLKANAPGEDIGCGRKYETMVFLAGKRCSSKDCGCGLPEISGSELDFRGYNTAREARDGHMALCVKWAKQPNGEAHRPAGK